MKRLCAAMAMSCVWAVALAAQQSATADSAKNDATGKDKSDKITVTGCLQSGDSAIAAATGTSGTTTTRSGSTTMPSRMASFILTNAVQSVAAASTSTASSITITPVPAAPPTTTPVGTSGSTTTATTPSSTGLTYRLDGDNLAKYVGKRVEVVGRIDSSGTMASSTATSTSAAAVPTPAHLKVTEVRELGDCSR
jgi:hypothetical protein